jgi:hypothetical protein
MKGTLGLLIVAAAALLAGCQDGGDQLTGSQGPDDGTSSDVAGLEAKTQEIQVATPTGNPAVDRASVEAAIAQAHEGDIVQFAAGTYAIGLEPPSPPIVVSVPGLTLQGHPGGTTLFGGAVTDFASQQGLQLTGGRQTVRDLTFESFFDALLIGGLVFGGPGEQDVDLSLGGYLVEGCTFKNSEEGVAIFLQSHDVSEVRRNEFLNIGSPISIAGRTLRAHSNSISAPEPEKNPFSGRPLFGGLIFALDASQECRSNVIENNSLEGLPDGFIVVAFGSAVCEKNEIRDNRATGQKLFGAGDFGTVAAAVSFGGTVRDNIFRENRLVGSEGVGIASLGGTGNLFLRNRIVGVTGSDSPDAPSFDGSGILLDEGSDFNRLIQNEFRDNAGDDVVLLGNHNLVVVDERNDSVLDQGQDNRIVGHWRSGSLAVPRLNATSSDELRRTMERKFMKALK